MREITWVAPDLAKPGCEPGFAAVLELARREAADRRVHLKIRTARWPIWTAGWPLHRKCWSLREARVLRSLRAAGLDAVEPRIAGAQIARGEGRAFLATRLLRGPDLERAVLQREAPSTWAASIGAALAALHGAGFVHRDAFLRNLVLEGRALVWIDAHRGGRPRFAPWLSPRGFAYDLACLELDLLAIAEDAERRFFWEAYLADAPFPPPRHRLQRLVAAARARLVRRFLSRRAAVQVAQAARIGLGVDSLLQRWARG